MAAMGAPLMPRPGPRRPLLGIRVKAEAIEAIDQYAKEAGVKRSEMVRWMLAYASAHMPRGWRPKS